MPASLGDKIRKHRLEKGYSLDKLAERTDSSKSYRLGARKPRYTQAVGRKADANRRSPLRHDGLPARRIR